ncbi:MAG: hydrogenase expression/formation protein HypE [Nitrospirae bacterium]|nr:hydrogenase expression/formation protein HypE [Nitrospirota bacterium]
MDGRILMGHGSGGRMMERLIRELIAPAFGMTSLADAADLGPINGRLAYTTDSYVVSPVFFPGGNIGELAVNGTVNDLSMIGAAPRFLTAGFIIEEGFSIEDLSRIVASMAKAADEAGVRIVAGDTKVVERGKCDRIFINTSGVGVIPDGISLGPKRIAPGDAVIVSGPVGSHGMAVMAERNGLSFSPPLSSDTAPLNGLAASMLEAAPDSVKMLRDPTRGGLATIIKEIAVDAGRRITLQERAIPVLPSVRGGCDLLGLDPLYVANEGVLVAVVAADAADAVLSAMRSHRFGKHSAIIGTVDAEAGGAETGGKALLATIAGGTRILDLLTGEQLPRIC